MARVIVCDECMKTNTLSLASVIQVDISVTAPDGTERRIKGAVSACRLHGEPVDAVAKWLGEDDPAPPATRSALPAASRQRGDQEPVYEFKCAKCSEVVDVTKRSYHAQARHMAKVAEIPWVPLFDVGEANFGVCRCGFVTQKGRQLTSHLKNSGHKEDVGKAPLKEDDFETSTAKAVFRAAGE